MTHPDPVHSPYEAAEASAAALARHSGVAAHDVAVVLGSGWRGALPHLGEVVDELPMAELGGLPDTHVAGHGSTVRSMRAGDRRLLVFDGRVHLYEGHHPNVVVHAVRTAVVAGCATVVLTNAAGGVAPGLVPGRPVLVRDHLNLTGTSPLLGPNDDRLGPRFPDLSQAWSPRLRAVASEVDPSLADGVYAGFLGPAYETPAEVAMARGLGADLVGMSTVLEAIAAAHAGADLLGLSLVTNLAAGLGGDALAHDDVLAVAAASADDLGALLGAIVARL
ncbi:MAG: purine-nucleoside phosphorylase [Acidimicrobiales bacterium]